MATPAATVREEVLTLTREQIIAIIEREAQKRLGLSARDLFAVTRGASSTIRAACRTW
jgi:hypothetical protein